jgi:hypothetical protein
MMTLLYIFLYSRVNDQTSQNLAISSLATSFFDNTNKTLTHNFTGMKITANSCRCHPAHNIRDKEEVTLEKKTDTLKPIKKCAI